jgi:glycosyltransferase involved in cell wall biosynthesis
VVATNVRGTREAVEDKETGFLVEPRSSEALLEPLTRLTTDPALRRRMGERGRQRVRSMFDQAEMVRAVVDHRLRLIADSQHGGRGGA